MFVTRNRAGDSVVLLLSLALFVTACGPPGPRALLQGQRSLEAGRIDVALQELTRAVSLLPTNAAAWNYLGLAYHRAGQSTNAIEAYSRAIRLDRELLEARFNLGCALLEENRLDAAKIELTAYTLRRGSETSGWLKLGAIHLRARDSNSAEKSFREALRIETNNVEALNGLGLSQSQRNRVREAAETFGAALKVRPDYRPALLNLATVLQQLNNRPEAIRRYREYLALQPRAADWNEVNAVVRALEQPVGVPQPVRTTNVVSGEATAALQSTNQSKSLTQQATATRTSQILRPTSNVAANPIPVATNAGAPNTVKSSPPPEVAKTAPETVAKSAAVETRSAITKPDPAPQTASRPANDSSPKAERAVSNPRVNPIARDSESPSRPQTLTAAATVSTPQKTDARRGAEAALARGQQAQRADRDAEAFQFFRRATQLDPTYFEAYYCLGLMAFRMRSFQTALNAWETALVIRPDNGDARYNLALTLKAANRPQDAAKELERLLSLHPDEARAHLTLGNLYADQLRDIPRARKHYNKVLQLDPRNPQAQTIRFWLVANPG